MEKNKCILITGCCGLIGKNFCEYILKNKPNYDIIGIDDLSGSYEEYIPTGIQFYKLNLLEYENVENIFNNNNIEVCFHFSAYAAECLSPYIRKYNYMNNLLCTTHLINCAIKYKVKRFVFTSSMATYGRSDGKLPFTEDSPQYPIDPYGIAKLAAEMDLKCANVDHNLEYCIIRPHNVYGCGQNIWDKYRNVLGIWMYQILNNLDITVYGDGEQTRAFTFIDDILEPLWKAGFDNRAKNQCINLGGKVEISLNEAAITLLKVTEYNQNKIKHLEPRKEVKHAYCSYQKSVDLLDYEMKTDLETGIQKMWEWAKKQPMKQRFFWGDKYELIEGIYSYWQKE